MIVSRHVAHVGFSRLVRIGGIALLLAIELPGLAQAQNESAPPAAGPASPAAAEKLNVLIFGDSLALCGFGKRLDDRFRTHPGVASTFSYMTCGTTPLSFLKEKPYTNVKTRCGFWSIESAPGSGQPKTVEDIYGMGKGGAPKGHDVPKLEDLLGATKPNVFIIQNENNLFGLFGGRNTVQPSRDGPALRRYLAPFVAKVLKTPSPLKRFYWVGSPVSGRVSKEIQDFVFAQIQQSVGATGMVIDSRSLLTYPYHHMEPDKEHFIGPEMDQWADRVFEIIERDLAAHPLASLKPLNESAPTALVDADRKPPEPPADQTLVVTAKLVAKSPPIPLQNLLPYQESLAMFVYDVKKAAGGSYPEKQMLIAHPACIALRPQPLDKFKVGKTYKLRVHLLRNSVWNTAKCKDDSGLINLEPYIPIEDEHRYPATAR
ncbi:MAG: hypothetical protein M3Z64_07545 [Verrucomicrobiota bacterium]|nr:hypothetical protein [Verrucomicrobiota bacterium]